MYNEYDDKMFDVLSKLFNANIVLFIEYSKMLIYLKINY